MDFNFYCFFKRFGGTYLGQQVNGEKCAKFVVGSSSLWFDVRELLIVQRREVTGGHNLSHIQQCSTAPSRASTVQRFSFPAHMTLMSSAQSVIETSFPSLFFWKPFANSTAGVCERSACASCSDSSVESLDVLSFELGDDSMIALLAVYKEGEKVIIKKKKKGM